MQVGKVASYIRGKRFVLTTFCGSDMKQGTSKGTGRRYSPCGSQARGRLDHEVWETQGRSER